MRRLVLISFLPFWIVVPYILTKWPRVIERSFSMHGAASWQSYWLFALAISYCALTYAAFNTFWYIDSLQLGWLFTVIVTLVALLQLIFAWVPDRKGMVSRVHRAAAYVWAFLLYVSFIVTWIESPLNTAQRAVIVVVLAILTICAVVLWKSNWKHQKYLIFQLISIGTIHSGIILLTYLN